MMSLKEVSPERHGTLNYRVFRHHLLESYVTFVDGIPTPPNLERNT